MNLVVLIGNPRPGSRTATAAVAAARAVAEAAEAGTAPGVVDLAPLAPWLLDAHPATPVQQAVERVLAADVLVVASPAYKGSYTGLLKVFLDRLPSRALAGKVALPLLVMGAPQHALAVEVHLRPLLVELGAQVPTPGLALLEGELDRLDGVLAGWATQIVSAVKSALTVETGR